MRHVAGRPTSPEGRALLGGAQTMGVTLVAVARLWDRQYSHNSAQGAVVLSRIHPSPLRARIAGVGALVACLTICLTLLSRQSAAATPAVPVTPFLDCVRFDGDRANPLYTAYFGYNNTRPVAFTFAVGADNAVTPGSSDAGHHAHRA
jgi:hypothetical protein